MRVKNNSIEKIKIKEANEAESILASKNVKVFMKLDNPQETYDLFLSITKYCQKTIFLKRNN